MGFEQTDEAGLDGREHNTAPGEVVAFRRPSMIGSTVMARGFDEDANAGFVWVEADNGDKLMMVALSRDCIAFTRTVIKGLRMEVDLAPVATTPRPDLGFDDSEHLVAFRPGPGVPLSGDVDAAMLCQRVLYSPAGSVALCEERPNQGEVLCSEIRRAREEGHAAVLFLLDRAT